MFNFNIIKLDATTSSNDWLKDRFLSGDCVDGDVIWVKNQTQGRGQRNKVWETNPGKNLTFSLFKQFSNLTVKNSFLINCAVSLSIVEAINDLIGIDLKLKWPNDILSGRNKIGGVLIENMVKGAHIVNSIIGIGINVNQKHFEGLPFASSLLLKTGEKIEIRDLLEGILKSLPVYFEKLLCNEGAWLLKKYELTLFLKGKTSLFVDDSESFEGIILGVTENGLLRVQKPSGEIFEYSHGAIQMVY